VIFQEKEFASLDPDYFIIDIGRKVRLISRDVGRYSINNVFLSKYLFCCHSAFMEAAGFIMETFKDCQLTVITAMVNDSTKDRIKVQKGNSIL